MAQQPNRALYGAQRFVRVARSLVDPQPRVNPAERLLAQSSEDSNLPSVGPNLSSDGSNLPSEDSLVLPEDSLLQDRVGLYAPRETPPHQSQDRPILTVICDMLSCSFRRLCRVACRFMGALVLVLIFFSSMSLVCSIESPLMQALSSISFPADKLRSFTGHVPPFSDIWNGSLEISRNLYLRSTHTMGDSSPPHESPPQSGISPAINAHMTISLDVDSGKALNTIPMNMSVVHEGTSPTLRPRFDADVIARLLGTPRRTPEAVLSRDTRPGTCWPMLGSAGHITLRLRSPNTDNSSSLLHSGEIATASARGAC
ncbi:hypothetical protein K474DRAFT_1520745 [Panus rudis PR-1116 ss-1]|nr:hypothetical protein K474DRAFT_1520745 [Panus rudis PR-1116 ss-1]